MVYKHLKLYKLLLFNYFKQQENISDFSLLYIGLDIWKAGFLIESIYLLFSVFCILISSKDYFSIVLTAQEHKLDIDCTTYKEHILHHQKKDTVF